MTPLVVLVGPPGAGKSTVGRMLADKLGVGFRDTDDDIVATAGKAVSAIFLDDGEPVFREYERAAVASALAEHDGVLALGGGAVLAESTRVQLAGHRVVFLDVGMADAVQRVGLGSARPVLLGNPRATFAKLLDERRPHYLAVATHTVDTTGRSAEDVVADLLVLVQE